MGLLLHPGHPLGTGHDILTVGLGFVVLGFFVWCAIYGTFNR